MPVNPDVSTPPMSHLFEGATEEFETRIFHTTALPMVAFKPVGSEIPLVPPGTVTLFMTPARSKVLNEVRKAVENPLVESRAMRHLAEQLKNRNPMKPDEALHIIKQQPVLASLHYGASTLAQHLFVPRDLDAVVLTLPYNGGSLLTKGFSLIQASAPKSKNRLDGIIVKHAPILSSAEKAALGQLPKDNAGFNVGQPLGCYALTAVGLVAAAIAAGSTLYAPRVGDPHIDDAAIRNIGPEATARQLLNMRRKLLQGRSR